MRGIIPDSIRIIRKALPMTSKIQESNIESDCIGRLLAGKYLTFSLNNGEYGIEILKVNQIIRLQTITAIPHTPPYIRGVINLRGMIIPIIDLRRKFDMTAHGDTERSCIVVIKLEENGKTVQMGIVIDEVREVLEISADDIEAPPDFGIGINTEFIMGIAKTGNRVKMLIEIGKALSSAEIKELAGLSKKNENGNIGNGN